ncbi:DnaJ family protein [Hondaea fermentalgiana]|uniref:DnaJ family protein n=1 Tax=Hondaea fermentalgiana TaxID=2315210 RepID=A0A2R5G0V2_9STRA|nr:DnaJ family protein [Hondaea fermentalgiana]|eukprot:GBG23919.1 DnaJ family protein [Hondaea fermentalgiana]
MQTKVVGLWTLLVLGALIGESAAFFGGGGGRRRPPPPQEVEEIDLYEVLGLDEDATDKEIKSAYRKLSLKYHPDRNPDSEDAENKFREVSFAYEILSSEEKKMLFDQGGLALVKEAEGEEEHGGGPGGMFGGIFGGMQRGNRGPDYQMRLKVTLDELYNGAEKETRINRRVVCARCNKKDLSAKAKERCASCGRCPNERRMVHRQMGGFIVQQEEEVPSKEKCKNEQKMLTAHIERGMQEGQEIRFKYMSEQQPKKIPGDVVFVLIQQKHRLFEREGNDLHMTIKISLKEALTGFSRTFKHLDEHEVEIDREDKITKPFETIVIPDEGMPLHEVPSQFGNLRVTFEVMFPRSLTAEQMEEIKKIL